MKFSEVETRVRRYIKDPDAKVWSRDLLMDLFNQAQDQFNKDTRMLVKIGGAHTPGIYDSTTANKWEEEYIEGTVREFGEYFEGTIHLCSFKWEVAMLRGYEPIAGDNYRVTHAWESYISDITVDDWDVLRFPDDFDKPILVMYNKKRLERLSESKAIKLDTKYKTRKGEPVRYIPVQNDEERQFAMYPRLNTVTFTDYGRSFPGYYNLGPNEGMITVVDEGTTEEYGTFYRWDDVLPTMDDYGIVVNYIPTVSNVTVVYAPRIEPVFHEDSNIANWLDWQVKYIERLMVSLAFSCNNNRYNPTLSGAWQQRYQDGLNVIQRYKGKRLSSITTRLRSPSRTSVGSTGCIKFPDTYPSVYRG